MKFTILFDLLEGKKELRSVVAFLFHGLQSRGYQVELLPPDDIHPASGDLLLSEKRRGEILIEEGRTDLVLLEKGDASYTLFFPGVKKNYTFSPGPNLDFFTPLEEEIPEERTEPQKVLVLWFNGDRWGLTQCLQGLEMIKNSVPPFKVEVISGREMPTLNTPLSTKKHHFFQISPQTLLEKYSRASLCLGFVPQAFFLQEVCACRTPVISLGEDLHPRIPHVSVKARDIAVTSLQIMKLGQLSSRLVQEGSFMLQEEDASPHLTNIAALLLEEKERILTFSEPEGRGEVLSPVAYANELEEGLYNTSFVLRRAIYQVMEFFQGRKPGPF